MTTTVLLDGEHRTSAPRFGRLLGTELRRLSARRFTRVLLGVCVLGYLIAVAYLFQSDAKPTAADYAQATTQRDAQIKDIAASIDQCLKVPSNTADTCGTVPTADQFPVDQFLANTPFRPRQAADYTIAVGVAVALAGFALGATFIGAEWSSRNVVAWLFYEPRRLRLLGAKLLAVTAAVLALSVFAQLVWALTARLLISTRGLPVASLGADATHFWSDLLAVQVRAALLVLPAVWLGFGLANLIRNTAAALGIAFVYFVVLESVIRAINPALQPYLFTTGVRAWITHGGVTVDGAPVYNQQQGFVAPEQIHVSNLQGAITLLIYALVVLAVSVGTFRRRDIT